MVQLTTSLDDARVPYWGPLKYAATLREQVLSPIIVFRELFCGLNIELVGMQLGQKGSAKVLVKVREVDVQRS